jgi:uncharacterized membrane protein YedE/YeeE
MTIDWLHFTPWSSLAGGMLLGLAASLLILLSGRIAGISGILGGLLRPARGDTLWRLLFLLGLLLSPLVYGAFLPLPELHVDAGGGALVAAGLLVGIGIRYGSGCTSGHGVCGIARRSPRSAAATALFVFAGFVTVYLLRHVSA